jgi:hypothetical protein
MSDELSAAEEQLARELRNLAVDPSSATRASIMRSVMAASKPPSRSAGLGLRVRVLTALLAATALLVAGSLGVYAASSEALPSSPAYSVRWAGEQVRLVVAGPLDREQLRIQFARDRFQQVQGVVRQNRSDAKQLIDDGNSYLDEARGSLGSLSADEQGQVENQLNQAGQDEQAAQGELNQEGQQGQSGS